jgi:predicted  nucleic acid-binding Zn-ribbon protein
MSTLTDNGLKELKDLINSKFQQVDRKFERVFDEFTTVKVEIATIKTEVSGINKRLDDTNKSIDNLEFTNRGIFIRVIGGLLLAVITLTIKF